MGDDEIYEGREQTQVKHYILSHYLERFAHIIGSRWNSITYIDGFAGPWNVRSSELSDSSFAIALQELRKARDTYRKTKRRDLRLRCYFLEQDRKAYTQLKAFASEIQDAEVRASNASFEDSVDAILEFIQKDPQTFTFLFIDPTGRFRLQRIVRLPRARPGEALINFMTSYIRRFPETFADIFGSSAFKEKIAGLSGLALDDALVAEFVVRLKNAGGFPYVVPAIVLHPEIDRTHFHLIYGTRHHRGVAVFKETEKRAMERMEGLRDRAQRRRREERTGNLELAFEASGSHQSHHYNMLRAHYLNLARAKVERELQQADRLLYDTTWILALSLPLVWESDLRNWIEEWRDAGHLRLEGLSQRGRVPQRESSHFLIWQGARH